jgi:DNA-binding NtrC family response regulator
VPPTSTSGASSAVIRLHPIRSLVLASDAAYRDRVLRIVGDLGPVVFASAVECGEPADVVALVRSERPDVVLLDASEAEASAERVIAALHEAAARVGIVVVCEHSTIAARRLDALPKWGWTQDLRRAVERAYGERGRRVLGRRPAGAPRAAGPLAGWDDR